jgi:hypothetical protein
MKRFTTVSETFLKRCVTVGLKRFMKKIRERGDLVKKNWDIPGIKPRETQHSKVVEKVAWMAQRHSD